MYNFGLLSLSVGRYKKGLLNGIESNNKVLIDIKNEIFVLLEKNIKSFIKIIKDLESDRNLLNNNKIFINISKEIINDKYNMNNDDNNSAYYLIKKILLLLSDIHIVLKYISSHKHLFEDDLSKLNLEKFVELIFNMLMNKKKNKMSKNYNNETERIKKHIKEIIKILLNEIIILNIQKNTDYIFGYLYDYISKEKHIKKNILELLRNILINYNKVSNNSNLNSDSNIIKISSKLLEFIEISNSPEIINLSSQIIIYIYKSISQKGKKEINNILTKDTEILFKKIGKLFMFNGNHKLIKENLKCEGDYLKKGNYYIMVQMNSNEIEYQFLVNELFYWEEKYPTELSKYKFESENAKEKTKKKVEYNQGITAENKYNIKLFNYFLTEKGEKPKTTVLKMTKLYKVVDEKLENIRKNLNQLEVSIKDEKIKEDKKVPMREKIKNFKKNQKYYQRIKAHIKLAEEIGEIASIKGYVILLPKLPHKKALELCELFYKAKNGLLKHFSSDVDNKSESGTLFNDLLIYPPLPKQNNLLAGITTTLKETTKSNLNFTLITEKEYNIISETYDFFSKEIKKISILDKKEKLGKYHDNYMLNASRDLINKINYNSYDKKIIDEENILTGKCITIIIQSIIELLYKIYELNSSIITKIVREKLKQIKTIFNFKNSCEKK